MLSFSGWRQPKAANAARACDEPASQHGSRPPNSSRLGPSARPVRVSQRFDGSLDGRSLQIFDDCLDVMPDHVGVA